MGGVRGGFRGDLLVPVEALGGQAVVRRVALKLGVPRPRKVRGTAVVNELSD